MATQPAQHTAGPGEYHQSDTAGHPRTAVHFIGAGYSELEPDERQNTSSPRLDRQGSFFRKVGGRGSVFAGGMQCGKRSLRFAANAYSADVRVSARVIQARAAIA